MQQNFRCYVSFRRVGAAKIVLRFDGFSLVPGFLEVHGATFFPEIDSVFRDYMGVYKNKGTPKSSILIGLYIINHPFWGTPIFGNIHIASIKQHWTCTIYFDPRDPFTRLSSWTLEEIITRSRQFRAVSHRFAKPSYC